MLNSAKRLISPLLHNVFPSMMKRRAELKYWRGRYFAENQVRSDVHYEPLYTTAFGVERNAFSGERVRDIGCGPYGSLEWAGVAAMRRLPARRPANAASLATSINARAMTTDGRIAP